MAGVKNTRVMRLIRHRRIRQKIQGTSLRPRLALFRSLNHIYAQVIDDTQGVTLVAASSMDSKIKESKDSQSKGKVSTMVGGLLAQRAKEKGISRVVFDTGGYKYHGRVKAFAEAAREAGLEF
ncbi:MAG: 50S ribosomal protein L18 [Dehalococcoidia bacterium]|jgi:large subunit ribosomal protein L18|nr:50S ribosomal protein L18 [Dehalococcoidia bacterium]